MLTRTLRDAATRRRRRDKAHFTQQGATQMATFVAAELRRISSPLAAYLKP